MKKLSIILLFIFICQVSLYSQNQQKIVREKHPAFSKVYLTFEAKSQIKKSILKGDIVKKLSELKPLLELNISSDRGFETIQARFYFRNINAFFEWYNHKETQALFARIDAIFKGHKTDLNYTKAAN